MATIDTIALALQAGVPVLASGGVGIGKTEAMNGLGRGLSRPVTTLIAALSDVTDVGGMPFIAKSQSDEAVMRFAPPDWAQQMAAQRDPILFLDELNLAPPTVLAGFLRLVKDRMAGSFPLPPGTGIVACVNPTEISAGGFELTAPMANRFCHLDWLLDIDRWCRGMIEGFPDPDVARLPATWTTIIPGQRALSASYVQTQRDDLYAIPASEADRGKAWPSPRTHDYCAILMAACESIQSDEAVKEELAIGCLGKGVGLKYREWVKNLNLPDPRVLLQHPDEFMLPQRGDVRYAVLNSVVATVVAAPSVATVAAGWRIMSRAADQGARDIACAVCPPLASLIRTRPDLGCPDDDLIAFIPALEIMRGWKRS